MRLIDADALIDESLKEGAYGYVDTYQIANAPTVDAVKHGHWLFYEEPDGYYHSECSECGQWCDEDVFLKDKWHFCPNCGTKMDKDEWQEPEINPCRGCNDYDSQGGCKSNGGCMPKPTTTVNRGKWIKVNDDYNNYLYECSCCHTWTSLPTEEVNDGNIRYCWSCGARMDGGGR